jgi:hypothetical protein
MRTYWALVVGVLRGPDRAAAPDPDAGYTTETVVVTALLVVAAIVVVAIIVAKVTAKANGINLGL